MDNITIIKELKRGVDNMNTLLSNVEDIIASIDDNDVIMDIISALEVLYLKMDVTRHCIQEIRDGKSNGDYGKRVIEDNRKTLLEFHKEISKHSGT